ncbi:MAG TPA: hypothetical protein G4O07_02005 [Dehalococcoidia bacterium]|nr:hypothetical protein [Dehalococcoidia bacterium]
MENSNAWPVVVEKMEELRSLTEEQWKTGGWEIAVLGERVLKVTANSKCAAGYLRTQAEAFQATTDSFIQTARKKIEGPER